MSELELVQYSVGLLGCEIHLHNNNNRQLLTMDFACYLLSIWKSVNGDWINICPQTAVTSEVRLQLHLQPNNCDAMSATRRLSDAYLTLCSKGWLSSVSVTRQDAERIPAKTVMEFIN